MKGSRFLATKISVVLAICAFFAVYAVRQFPNWPSIRENPFALSKTVKGDDYLPSDRIRSGEEFRFHIAYGSGLHGYDQLLVSGDGAAQYVLRDDTAKLFVCKLATFQLSPAEVERLCEELRQLDFGNLNAEYHANVHDGTQVATSVQCGQLYKHVYCNNYFPDGILRLRRHVQEVILSPHQAEIDAAVEISFEEYRKFPGAVRQPLLPADEAAVAAE